MYPLRLCAICKKALLITENYICNECLEIQEKEEIIEQTQKVEILSIFYNMNKYEMKALEEFIHKIGKEYKKKATLEKIEKLQKELEE